MAVDASSGSAARRLTVDEWAALPEDAPGELVRGVLVEEEMPSVLHEAVLTWLIFALRAWALSSGARVLTSGTKYAVSSTGGRMPDLSIFLAGARRPPAEGVVRVPPTIALEIVSPSAADARRDRVDKLAEYAAFGVRWYWIVDPGLRTFEVLELDDASRYCHTVAAAGGLLRVPGCGDLTLDIDALWREVDAVLSEGAAG
jgi:Uma2 family endonuclease